MKRKPTGVVASEILVWKPFVRLRTKKQTTTPSGRNVSPDTPTGQESSEE